MKYYNLMGIQNPSTLKFTMSELKSLSLLIKPDNAKRVNVNFIDPNQCTMQSMKSKSVQFVKPALIFWLIDLIYSCYVTLKNIEK